MKKRFSVLLAVCLMMSVFFFDIVSLAKTYEIPLFVSWKGSTIGFRICTDPEAAIGENYPLSDKVTKAKVTKKTKYVFQEVDGTRKRISMKNCKKGLLDKVTYRIWKITVKKGKVKLIKVLRAAD